MGERPKLTNRMLIRRCPTKQLFLDCNGAIDRTYIPVMVPTEKAVPNKSGRKYEKIQNVIVVCSLTCASRRYGLAGGLAHDFHIFTEATTRQNTNFPPCMGSIMSLMLATLTHGITLLLTEVVGIICRTTEVGVVLRAIRRYSTTRTPRREISSKDILGF